MADFDGRRLIPTVVPGRAYTAFQTLDRRVVAVSSTAKGDSFTHGDPRVWSESHLVNFGGLLTYDLVPVGKRLAAILENAGAIGQKQPTHLSFLINFFDELRRRAPAGRK